MKGRKWILPLIALLGAIGGVIGVIASQRKVPVPPILFPPPKPPYKAWIAGSGILEASSLNISIGVPFTEVVTDVYVVEGQLVKQGDPLFKIYTKTLENQRFQQHMSVNFAKVTLEDKKTQYSFYERLTDKRAVSEQAQAAAYYAVKEAEEQLRVAEAQLEVIHNNIERSTIRAPIDGKVLQVSVAVGEIALQTTIPQAPTVPFSLTQAPLMLLGSLEPPYLRIDIDEEDAWRYKPGSAAVAFVRGNGNICFPLEFVRVEPYVIPKVSFTGQVTERIDTRVLQVLYKFQWDNLPIYTGQLFDIYIDAEPIEEAVRK